MRTRRQLRKRKERIAERKRQENHSPTAKPSEHGILYFDELPTDCTIVIHSRVSGREQERKKKLSRQVRRNRRIVGQHGNPIAASVREVASGWATSRPELERAVAVAKRRGAVIVVESIDRLLRNEMYRDNNDLEPTVEDFKQLAAILDGVQVATICHPDTPRKGKDGKRSIETQRGQSESGKLGGRPRKKRPGYKKQIRCDKRELAIELFGGDAWMSIRGIGRKLNVAPQTVHDWIWAD